VLAQDGDENFHRLASGRAVQEIAGSNAYDAIKQQSKIAMKNPRRPRPAGIFVRSMRSETFLRPGFVPQKRRFKCEQRSLSQFQLWVAAGLSPQPVVTP
jgi:hypothetical protein